MSKRAFPFAAVLLFGGAAFAEVDVYFRVVAPEYREVPAEEGSEVLVLGPDGKAETGKFHVSATMNAKVFGQMDAAEERFVKAASTATRGASGPSPSRISARTCSWATSSSSTASTGAVATASTGPGRKSRCRRAWRGASRCVGPT